MNKKTGQNSKTQPRSKSYPTREECICLLLDKEKLIQINEARARILADLKLIQELLPPEDDPQMIFCIK